MSDIQQLTAVATQAVAALLLRQLELISNSTNIPINVLCSYTNMQVPEVQTPVQTPAQPEKKKRAPPKKKAAAVADAVEETVVAETEVPEKKKRAPPKKKEKTVEAVAGAVVAEAVAGAVVAEAVVAETEVPEKKKRAPPKKKVENEKKAVSSVISSEDGEESDSSSTTVMVPQTCERKRPDVFMVSHRINVERVEIDGISYLIGENGVAYHESTKRMVGKYDSEQNTIRNLMDSEYNEYYGSDDEDDEDDEDECPALSDSEE